MNYFKKLTVVLFWWALCHNIMAQNGALFHVSPTGPTANVKISLCLNGKGALSCQYYNVSALNLSIRTLIPHHRYPIAGIKINTPGYRVLANQCTPNSNGYCLFSVSDTVPKNISINSTQTGVSVDLSTQFTNFGLTTNALPFDCTYSLDGAMSYSATLLGTSQSFNGTIMNFGSNASNTQFNGIKANEAQTAIPLPSGQFSKLNILATGISPQTNQDFIITYTDNSSVHFIRSLSDWASSAPVYPGETKVVSNMAYRNNCDGTEDVGSFNLYGYSFALNSSKTVKSITLPNNDFVFVMAMSLL